MQPKRHGYSFIRHSTRDNAPSTRRQIELRDKILAQHGDWVLTELPFEDTGTSAFSGDSAPIASFIAACQSGQIPKNSVIIIETWDRLTRRSVVEIMELFARLARCQVHVCTAIDGNIHTPETMKDPANLLHSVIRMQIACEESQKRSDRAKKAIHGAKPKTSKRRG